jgi:hypothetical protein
VWQFVRLVEFGEFVERSRWRQLELELGGRGVRERQGSDQGGGDRL